MTDRKINVLVAATPSDLEAEGIAAAVAGYAGMTLVDGRRLALAEVDERLDLIPRGEPCALILIGNNVASKELAFRLLAARSLVPVIALGGMTAQRARRLGAARWAAIDGLCGEPKR